MTKVQILIDEEEQNQINNQGNGMTMGECLEHMLSEKIFEVLCSYIATDKPAGFLPRGLSLLADVLFKIETISLLAQITVHPAINHILGMILKNLNVKP